MVMPGTDGPNRDDRLWSSILLVVPLILLNACQRDTSLLDSLKLAPVHGTVTFNGKPLTDGKVLFAPENDQFGAITSGPIQNDGTYQLETNGREGAIIGWNCVTVRSYAKKGSQRPGSDNSSPIPEKYTWADQTPLRFEVKPGPNQYHITLE